MKAQRVRRLFAVSAAGVLLAGGAAISTAGTASAATPDQVTTNRGCGYGWGGCNNFGRGGFFGNGFGYGNGYFGTGVVVIVVG
ncbi:hypothetical protein ACF073_12600 [Streptomyces sp. NPDC015171]|uniref:hypothetical protein n=1 Tax=Streptomyces sp. NPDC015171 TaxID=3364945 RepID=UPI0036FE5A8E